MKDPTTKVRILSSFLAVRQNVPEQVTERTTEPLINVTTYRTLSSTGELLCEDVVVESRPHYLKLVGG